MPTDRHFEKRGRRNLSRRIRTSGTRLRVTLGLAADYEKTFTATFKSAAAASRAADLWASWALHDGFAEVTRPSGALGQVSMVEAPAGRGRIRLDASSDVYFDREASSPHLLRQSDRVIVQHVVRDPRLKVDFLFGSQLRAGRVVPFPEVDWKRHKAGPELAPAQRRTLLAALGALIQGKLRHPSQMKPVPLGTLIFSYEKGVHRFLGGTRDRAGRLGMVIYEPVFSSKLLRLPGPLNQCAAEWCTPVPRQLARELQSFLDKPSGAPSRQSAPRRKGSTSAVKRSAATSSATRR